MYYLLVFLCISIISVGLIYLKKPFFSFAYATSTLLDVMLNSDLSEQEKQKQHLRRLLNLLKFFLVFLLKTAVILLVASIPIVIYMWVKHQAYSDLDTSSLYFFLCMVAGSVVLFIIPKKEKSDYSPWSKLLHRMVLDNYNNSKYLFNVERKKNKKLLNNSDSKFAIVTGLARGGTTALTTLLYKTDKFYSLSYKNMPFLLSVNTWSKIYNPKNKKLKERAHGDNILFGYDTIEALEEYFYKVHLKDSFIEGNTLKKHEIDEETYQAYIDYQKLIGKQNEGLTYLAKNNNLILRYHSLRQYNSEFKIIMLFRDPVSHAKSLLTQHQRFVKMQTNDTFTLEYMNWLAHHEFGLNHKIFDIVDKERLKGYSDQSINYWISIWLDYYSYVLELPEDTNLYLIDYNDLCSDPNNLVAALCSKLDISASALTEKAYTNKPKPIEGLDSNLLSQAELIHTQLIERKFMY